MREEVRLEGGGATTTTVSAAGLGDRVIDVVNDSDATIRGLRVSGGNPPDDPNRFNVSLGGGISNLGTGEVELSEVVVSENTAADFGGGIFNFSGTVSLTNSTVSDNTAGGDGGGIYSNTNLSGQITTTIENSTISGNSAADRGGGVFNIDGLTTIRTTTITANSAAQDGGAGVASFGDNATRTVVGSSIIAANEGPDPNSSTGTDVDFVPGAINSFESEDFNVVGDGNATPAFNNGGDQTGVADPSLGPLAANGGPTLTHALLSTSPAIDRVATANCPPPETDQRGMYRPQDGDGDGTPECDSGSLEANFGSVRFETATYSVNEADGTATITVLREGGTDGQVKVDYATSDGSAQAGIDYTQSSGELTFSEGEDRETFPVPITDDPADEPDETINLTLSNPRGGATLASPTEALLTIEDDDEAPTVSIRDTRLTEGNSGSTNARFTVRLTGNTTKTTTVRYATSDGSAKASDNDHEVRSGTLTFQPGQRTKEVKVPVNGDTKDERDETLRVNLSNPTAATISDGRGIGTIVDDDDNGPACTINARRGEVTRGTNGDDVICGTSANDVIYARGGYDIIRGGEGEDKLYGEDGSDTIRGEEGTDLLIGGTGADVLEGGSGEDIMQGEEGEDTLEGRDQAPNDALNGGPGTDRCTSDSGDTIQSCP